jgi:predicted GH43/DUF377 family glycosyl hydrolase
VTPIDLGLRRLPPVLRSDPARVLARPFFPAAEPRDLHRPNVSRATRIIARVHAMEPAAVAAELAAILRAFGDRHRDLRTLLADRYAQVLGSTVDGIEISDEQRLLIGSYFIHEYSFEASALFNPSIVAHPDQAGLAAGELRFVLSLRATGEGHVSSVAFRSGTVSAAGEVRVDPSGRYAIAAALDGVALEESEYDVVFTPGTPLAERVIFPITQRQRNGIEDARFVRFVEDDGEMAYYATVTAYSGHDIAPELLRTDDFLRFRFLPLRGDAVRNKGMALFPRRIGGRYAMLARLDGETLQLVQSDDLGSWNGATNVLTPTEPWEFVQIGNSGSPIELPEGWLVLTHGVGPMRRYCLGAALLDLHDPTRVLARLRAPLLEPEEGEREGYVPNVVYSCGALIHAGNLILPFAVADTATTFATVPLHELLSTMS